MLSHSEHLKPFVILLEDKVKVKEKIAPPASSKEVEIKEKVELP
jgi:hypothetical protein